MSISKTYNVSFNVNVELTDKDEEIMSRNFRNLAKWAATGEELPEDARNILLAALTFGPEGVADHIVRTVIRETLSESIGEISDESDSITVTPVAIHEV